MPVSHLCAWCGMSIPPHVSGSSLDEEKKSYGICAICANRIYSDLGVDLRTFLDKLAFPVLLVGEDRVIQAANHLMCTMAGKDFHQVEGLRPGAVFQCAYANLPGGCGETIHCSGCAIRISVAHTFATGNPLNYVPATLMPEAGEVDHHVAMLVSTRKVGDYVLLIIDEVTGDSA